MIKYISTRGGKKFYTFSEVIMQGIAPDGGLFVPKTIPKCTTKQLEKLVEKTYQEKAITLFELFQTGFSKDILTTFVTDAYGSQFDDERIAPVVPLTGNQYLLELWHGPTLAFKDMALQLMPLFFSEAVKYTAENYLILVATSGDTGKAALEGYKDKESVSIMVFYPYGRVSQFQELQMVSQEGNNVSVVAVEGDFDDCQRCVKEVFADAAFRDELLKKDHIVLSSANSINWGRLLPQIVYFFHGYLELVRKHVINLGDEIDVSVPTGNFGNILAAYYAKKMGLPIRTFLCASNANNVLTDFLQTGVYDIRDRRLIKTPSPSMDILIASNIERLLYLLTDEKKKVSEWMHELQTKKRFIVDEATKQKLKTEFVAGWVDNKDSLDTIAAIYKQTKYLMDPHTAVAQLAATRVLGNSSRPVLIASTAHWTKFAQDVYNALAGKKKIIGDEFETAAAVKVLAPHTQLPQQFRDLQHKKRRHSKKSEATKEAVEKVIRSVMH